MPPTWWTPVSEWSPSRASPSSRVVRPSAAGHAKGSDARGVPPARCQPLLLPLQVAPQVLEGRTDVRLRRGGDPIDLALRGADNHESTSGWGQVALRAGLERLIDHPLHRI